MGERAEQDWPVEDTVGLCPGVTVLGLSLLLLIASMGVGPKREAPVLPQSKGH